MSSFGAPVHDLKKIYLTYIRGHCERTANLWHSGLTEYNKSNLERVQKEAGKIILKERYKNYSNALSMLDLQTLNEIREDLACPKMLSKSEY